MLNELEALIILTQTPFLGSIRIQKLIHQFGTAIEVLEQDESTIRQFSEFGERLSYYWKWWERDHSWKGILELTYKNGIKIVPYNDLNYPKRLLKLVDFPILLYMKGQISDSDQQAIAVVGTRNASLYGKEMAEQISHQLSAVGFTVVSGLARGIDTAAHHGALKKGRTIAVIGSGLMDIYPQENRRLAEQIERQGVVISEFSPKTPPDRQNFPQRNRIVSGMTMATLLIEAPVKSGAMITVEKALSNQRPIFALPGRVDFPSFTGNHHLIKNGKARLIENANDIIEYFSDIPRNGNQHSQIVKGVILNTDEQVFLNLLPEHELTFEEIVNLTTLPVMKINVMLMGLLLKKAIKELPGRIYRKVLDG